MIDISSNCFVFQLPTTKLLEQWAIVRTQAWRSFLHSLTAVSLMFCFRPIQTSPVTFWVHKHSWTLSLLYDDQTL